MTQTVISQAANGHPAVELPLEALEMAFTLNGSEQVTAITVVFNGVTYIQTFTLDGSGNVTNISQWVPQP